MKPEVRKAKPEIRGDWHVIDLGKPIDRVPPLIPPQNAREDGEYLNCINIRQHLIKYLITFNVTHESFKLLIFPIFRKSIFLLNIFYYFNYKSSNTNLLNMWAQFIINFFFFDQLKI